MLAHAADPAPRPYPKETTEVLGDQVGVAGGGYCGWRA